MNVPQEAQIKEIMESCFLKAEINNNNNNDNDKRGKIFCLLSCSLQFFQKAQSMLKYGNIQ